MQNKFPGKCACGAYVEAGTGEVERNRTTGKWDVRCAVCIGALASVGAGAPTTPAFVYAPKPQKQDGKYILLSGHEASDAQAAIFEHFAFGHGSVIIKAVAGSGKTTSMKNALRYAPQSASIQLFAFGREAAAQLKVAIQELEERDGRDYSRVRAGTFHSVGLRAVLRHLNLPKNQIQVDDNKSRKLLKEKLGIADLKPGQEHPGREIFEMYGAFVCQLLSFVKGEGLGTLVPLNPLDLYRLIDHHGMSLSSENADAAVAVEMTLELLQLSNESAKKGFIDNDDMLYLVCLWKLRLWQNDIVVIDEAQDTNPVRRAIACLALRPGGKLYAVGDEKQSIMGFTGASSDAMELIRKEFNCQELPLTVSYRCARKIVERAQTWVPYIEASPFAEEGCVDDDVPLHEALEVLTAQDAILCRQTAPLVELAYGLISKGRACRILGREIGTGLINLIENQRARGIPRLTDKLTNWRNREMAKFIAKGEEGKAEAVEDRVACIFTLIDTLPETERTIPALIARIESLFSDNRQGENQRVLTLCTQHKSKGLEWNRIAILRPELNPSKAARQAHQIVQEYNLMYVAITRAKQHAIYCLPEDMQIAATN